MLKTGSTSILTGLALSFGLLMWLAWPPLPFTLLIFAAWIPLFYLEEQINSSTFGAIRIKLFAYSYLSFFIWNLLTTWWIFNATAAGAAFAILVNPLLMTIPIMLFFFTKKHLGASVGYFSLLIYWVGFEYFHLQWDLSWPWLNLGNAFSLPYRWIQWYEYTGVLGGTVWVLVVNILFFIELHRLEYYRGMLVKRFGFSQSAASSLRWLPLLARPGIAILLPILFSLFLYGRIEDKGDEVNITVVQPNYEPHEEKYEVPVSEQVERMMSLSNEVSGPETDYIVWPEASIISGLWLEEANVSPLIRDLKEFMKKYPAAELVAGVNGLSIAGKGDECINSRKLRISGADTLCYNVHNTAIQVNSQGMNADYYKSKLVPGAEQMPYLRFFSPIKPLYKALESMTADFRGQPDREVFFSRNGLGLAPVICYESVYGEYCSEYIRNGAGLIFIITNDGWWGNTAGHKQHFYYARLRSIENRRSLARSANTGISCFINQRGDVFQATPYATDTVINASIRANKELTFYSAQGDFVGRTCSWVAVGLFLLSFVSAKTNNFMFRVNRLN